MLQAGIRFSLFFDRMEKELRKPRGALAPLSNGPRSAVSSCSVRCPQQEVDSEAEQKGLATADVSQRLLIRRAKELIA